MFKVGDRVRILVIKGPVGYFGSVSGVITEIAMYRGRDVFLVVPPEGNDTYWFYDNEIEIDREFGPVVLPKELFEI